jgi:hypothetical protein
MNERQPACRHDQAAVTGTRERRNCALDLGRVATGELEEKRPSQKRPAKKPKIK